MIDVNEALNACADQIKTLKDRLRQCRRWHYYCEDRWYACPKSEEGCANDAVGPECNCGADDWNADLEEFIAKF